MTSAGRLAPCAAVLFALSLLPGCDLPSAPPTTPKGNRVQTLQVTPSDSAEQQAASELEAARINYRYRLEVLRAYYNKVGNADKYRWTGNEIDNLDQAWTFSFGGLAEIKPPAGESLEEADERMLVEYLVAARRDYLKAVAAMEDYYQQARRDFQAKLMRNVQARFDPVRMYMYYFAAEVPPEQARPVAVIPEAETLFADGLKLFQEGKGLLHFSATTSYAKEREALTKLLTLVSDYPTSNKVPESCYYIGDIYKEYFNEDVRAVQWYRRAWQLDPNLEKPARFQAATVYDFRLQDKERALECYRLAIKYEQFNSSNIRYSQQRIGELTESTE